MEKEILEQILAQQIILIEEIRALKKEVATLTSQVVSVSKAQKDLNIMQEREAELLRKSARVSQNIADALGIKPELTTEEIRQQIEFMENSIPKRNFGEKDDLPKSKSRVREY